MEILGLVWALVKLVFMLFFWLVVGIVDLITLIIRHIRESRARRLREELEAANARQNAVEESAEEFISGNPDPVEEQIKDGTGEVENDFELNNQEKSTPFEREIIETPKQSRWDLLKPDKKSNEADDGDKKPDQ